MCKVMGGGGRGKEKITKGRREKDGEREGRARGKGSFIFSSIPQEIIGAEGLLIGLQRTALQWYIKTQPA